MGKKRFNRAARSMRLFLIALVAAFLAPVAVSSAADKVANPGLFKAEITGGLLIMKNGDKDFEVPIDQISPAPILRGNVTAAGEVIIKTDTCQTGTNPNETQPATCGVVFPPLEFDLNGDIVYIFIRPTGTDWVGNIDPDSGEYSLNARLRIQAAGNPSGISLGSSCFVGASGTGNNLHLNPAVNGSIPANGQMEAMQGKLYDGDTGELEVVNNTVAVPAGSGCGPLGLADSTLNGELGLPSPGGNNALSLGMRFVENAPQAPAVARYTANPEQGRIPFDVDFDASASTSTLGAIDGYHWDFDGDGVVDQTTTEPTVTHTYETAGVYPTRLTVESQGYETSRSRATITARSIVTTYTEKPEAFSKNRDANFAFESNEPGTFECQLSKDGNVVSDWASCVSPVALPELEDGDYNFKTRATPVGESSPGLPATWDFRVDNVAPVISIPVKPAAVVNYNQFAFGLASNEDGTSFECRILQDVPAEEPAEGEEPVEPTEPEFEPCDNPAELSWQALEGPVEFQVKGTDRAGNTSDPVSASWTVDLTPPVTTFTAGPPNPTNQVGGAYSEACDGTSILGFCIGTTKERSTTGNLAQSFAFAANETGSTYVCKFNDEAERACITGVQTGAGVSGDNNSFSFNEQLRRLGTPVQGTNTLRVWATDPAGNREAAPSIRTYVYDTIAPVITALSKPAAFTKSVNNTVIFQSNEPVVNFECRTVNNAGTVTTGFANNTSAPTGFAPCSPGLLNPTLGWYSVEGQTDGRKGVQVRGTDAAGNVLNTNATILNNGGLTTYWTVDNTIPTVSFAGGSQEQGSYTNNTSATINLSAADTPINFGVAANDIPAQQPSYACSLNGAAFTACATPVNLTDLTPGAKSLRVRVTDQATNVSNIIERNWTVVNNTNASVELTSTPAAVIGHRNPSYEFTPSSGTSECRIDANATQNETGTGWAACTSPASFSGLADGNHQVEIRANNTSVPVVHNFAVYANTPTMTVGNLPGIQRPAGRYTGLSENSGSISLTAPANPSFAPGATTYECRYYQAGDAAGPWEVCESPYQVNWDKNDHGAEMRFDTRPVSSTGNTGAEQNLSWTVDADRPTVAWGNPGVATACGRGAINGPGPAGCVATNNSTQPWSTTNVTTPQFRATTDQPILNSAASFACQLNGGAVQNPCVARTTSPQATGNPLTVTLGGSRGANSDAFGTAIVQNGSNTFRVWAVDNGGNMSTDSVNYTFIHDSAVPTFAITSAAPARTNQGTVDSPLTIEIEASEDMHPETGFACRLINNGTTSTNGTNPGANPPNPNPASGWTVCPMDLIDPEDPAEGFDLKHATWTATDLAEGNYALDIRGWDKVWNVATGTNSSTRPNVADNNNNGRRYIFTIDRTAPVVNISGGPAQGATVPATGGEFIFAPNEAAGQIDKTECRLDPADPDDLDTNEWEACSGSFAFSDLDDGAHVFQVRSLDTAGNQGAPTTRNWTVDSTMPVIDLSSNLNGGITNQTAVSFNYTVTPVDSSLECRLLAPEGYPAPDPDEPVDPDAEPTEPAFEACASPKGYTDLIDGEYTFEVKATNTLGTVGEIASRTWTVDTVAPVATIGTKPAALTKNTNASFTFSADKSGSTFECDLDGTVADCESPKQYTGLADGNHNLKVRAIDPAGNESAWVEHSWTIDTVAPVTTITSGPSGTEETRSASLAFSADKAGSTFECKLDAGNWGACASPQAFSDLANGLHEFRVRATDALGNVGVAAERNWAVDVKECPPGQVGSFPDCKVPCTADQIGEPGNCQPKPCPTGTSGTYPNCVPDECPEGQVGTPPNCEQPSVCPDGQFGTPPNCKSPLNPIIKPTVTTGTYDPATGKLQIRLKCPAAFKPKCVGTAIAVSQKKGGKVVSGKVKNSAKAGKFKVVTMTIKKNFRPQVELMTTVNKKQLIVKQTLKSKKKKKKTVFHTYKVRLKG